MHTLPVNQTHQHDQRATATSQPAAATVTASIFSVDVVHVHLGSVLQGEHGGGRQRGGSRRGIACCSGSVRLLTRQCRDKGLPDSRVRSPGVGTAECASRVAGQRGRGPP